MLNAHDLDFDTIRPLDLHTGALTAESQAAPFSHGLRNEMYRLRKNSGNDRIERGEEERMTSPLIERVLVNALPSGSVSLLVIPPACSG